MTDSDLATIKETVLAVFKSEAEALKKEIMRADAPVRPGVLDEGRTGVQPDSGGVDEGLDLTSKFGKFMGSVFRSKIGSPTDTDRKRLAGYAERATLVGTADDATGGEHLIPEEFIPELVQRKQKLTVLFPRVRKIKVNRKTGPIPTLSTQASVAWGSEASTIEQTDATFDEKTFTAKRLQILSRTSREVFEDAAFDMGDLIMSEFAMLFAEEEDKIVAMGEGVTQPTGLWYASGTTAYSLGGALNYDAAVAIIFKLGAQYRAKAAWIGDDLLQQDFMRIKDSQGRPLFVPSPVAGMPATFLGYPFLLQGDIPNTGLLFGDLSYYWVFDRESYSVEMSTEEGDSFKKHLVGIKAIERWDADLMLGASFVKTSSISARV